MTPLNRSSAYLQLRCSVINFGEVGKLPRKRCSFPSSRAVDTSRVPTAKFQQNSTTTQNRVQRIPQESNYFVFRQLKISCREGGGSTTGE